MSASKKITLRVQWPEGTVRVETEPGESAHALWSRVAAACGLDVRAVELHRDRAKKSLLPSGNEPVRSLGLNHGDMLYLTAADTAPPTASTSNQSLVTETPGASASKPELPPEDDVDLELYQLDGNIQRQRDDKLCRHNSKGCCVHCSPLEPWDEAYLKEQNIKHMSFHSYLRKITSGKFITLEEISCKIKSGCKEHPPWPRGICSSCQPQAVTLTRQPYRHVDNVLIEHPALVERFLAYWRQQGKQRVGWLYGSYERHPTVPLGVRARVAAIYEPPQQATADHVMFDTHDANEHILQVLTGALGLRRVGWTFTDLVPLDLSAGTVRRVRGVDTHFLSAQECITAGYLQNMHPNRCRHATSGYFGSKFVTVCVTGSEHNQVTLEGYQVSGQCAALVRDEVLVPTRDAPDLGYVRDSGDAQYVPDVFYTRRDKYGNDVSAPARTVPTAYVLLDVPAGVSVTPSPLFSPETVFPPAHRPETPQSLRVLHEHVAAARSLLAALADLHVLLYLATNAALPLSVETLSPLLEAILSRDEAAATAACRAPQLATLLELARAAHDGGEHAHVQGGGGGGGHDQLWTCPLCTYHNPGHSAQCEMCAMPRNSA